MSSQCSYLKDIEEHWVIIEYFVQIIFLKAVYFIVLSIGLEVISILVSNFEDEARITKVAARIIMEQRQLLVL